MVSARCLVQALRMLSAEYPRFAASYQRWGVGWGVSDSRRLCRSPARYEA